MMRACLELAREAARAGEVPVGAIVVLDRQIVGRGRNRCVERRNPLAHAEIEALGEAFAAVGEARLPGCTLYCTLEPCFMCAGALLHARVARIVFGARDPKFGACASLGSLGRDARLNHRCRIDEGLGAEESAALLREFFQSRREGTGPASR
jgi:tRNA(adenine34) deaminase